MAKNVGVRKNVDFDSLGRKVLRTKTSLESRTDIFVRIKFNFVRKKSDGHIFCPFATFICEKLYPGILVPTTSKNKNAKIYQIQTFGLAVGFAMMTNKGLYYFFNFSLFIHSYKWFQSVNNSSYYLEIFKS